MSNLRTGNEIEFEVLGLKICAKQWGNPEGAPAIGLHGWLDNANTFDRLAPLLPELNFIAMDFAGHGRSDHRPTGVHYHPLYDMQDVLAVANELNWHQFHVIGHSMGASIASELAAMFPDRIRSAVHIDGFLATGGNTPEDRIEQSRLAIEKILQPHHKAKIFDSRSHGCASLKRRTRPWNLQKCWWSEAIKPLPPVSPGEPIHVSATQHHSGQPRAG